MAIDSEGNTIRNYETFVVKSRLLCFENILAGDLPCFRINQIMTSTQFGRSFREVTAFPSRNPEPLLVTQENVRFMVVMDGEFFDGLMEARAQVAQVNAGVHALGPSDFKS
jgi:hypothetical protein